MIKTKETITTNQYLMVGNKKNKIVNNKNNCKQLKHKYKHSLKALKLIIGYTICLTAVCTPIFSQAQEVVKSLKYGNFENWTIRELTESKIIGGKNRTTYVIGPDDTIIGNIPYVYGKRTNITSSNAMARVSGITKVSTTVFPEKRGTGTCARLDTKMETVKVLGIINISVLISGSIFLGETIEPVTSPSDPYGCLNMGVPFTGKPKALIFDYKCTISDSKTVQKCTTFSSSTFTGHDEGEAYIFLQKRWEDKDGNIYAKRIGTTRHRFNKTVTNWHNNFRLDIHYGDITKRHDYKPYMELIPKEGLGAFRAKNSKGEIVPIQEVGWGEPDEAVTHMILMITSGCYGAFVGTIGNSLWVDNIRLAY